MWGSITKLFKSAAPVFEGISAIAGAAGAVAPIVTALTQKTPKTPKVKSAAEIEAEAGAEATKRRQELARRKGSSSTYRTTKLGVTSDVYSKSTGIGGY